MRAARFALFLLPLLIISCTQPQPDVAGLRKAVDDFNAASKEAMMSGNNEKAISFYADDAFELAPNEMAIKGKAAIGEWQKKMSGAMKMTAVTFTTTDLGASGDMGYEIGEYDMTMMMTGMGEMKDKGKYATLWKKQQDGSWKVYMETWNTSMPMPEMKPAMSMKDKKTVKKADTKMANKTTKKAASPSAKKPVTKKK